MRRLAPWALALALSSGCAARPASPRVVRTRATEAYCDGRAAARLGVGFVVAGVAATVFHGALAGFYSGTDLYQDVSAGVGLASLATGIGLVASGHQRMNASRGAANLRECPD